MLKPIEETSANETEQEDSLLTILKDLENELLTLQARYQRKIPDTSSSSTSRSEPGMPIHEACLDFVNVYFHHTVSAYLAIIKIIRGYVENMGRIIHIRSDWNALKNHFISIGVFGLPHLFHPHFNERTQQFEIREDEGCYQLALILKKYLSKLPIAKVQWFLTAISTLVHESVKKYVKDPNFISRELAQRIARYEYNVKHRESLRHYSQSISPLLHHSERDLRNNCDWEDDELATLLRAYIDIARKSLQQPTVVAVYLRDYTCSYANNGIIWGYSNQLVTHFSKKHTQHYRQIRQWFWGSSPANTVHLSEVIGSKFFEFTTIFDEEFEFDDSECSTLLTTFKELTTLLSQQHKAFLVKYESLRQARISEVFSEALHTRLLPAIEVHKDYMGNSGFLSSFFSSSTSTNDENPKTLLRKLCKDLFIQLETHALIAPPGAHSDGHSDFFIMRDFLNQTLPLAESTKLRLEEIKLQDTPEYIALSTYIRTVKSIADTLNKCADNLETSVKVNVHQDGSNINSNNPGYH